MPSASKAPSLRHARLMVGLEVHVELATRSKMFSRAPNVAHPEFAGAAPNTLVDPVVAALPGTLPVMNGRAVEMSAMVGLALGCSIAPFSKWDRKNYFYPDLPKGYQISQYDLPLCRDGAYEYELPDGTRRRVGIIRAHLEEDTGKLGHELPGGLAYEGSLVDLNRAGTPLLEVVTAPDFTSAEEVVAFAQELRAICRSLGVCEGVLQRGHMRFEPNINMVITLDDGSEVRTPIVEVKNLNSFKAVRGAIEHETRRQVEEWQSTGRVMGRGMKATRGWDDVRQVTVLQREKEDAHDYRYFPDPDLVPVAVDADWVERLRGQMSELPAARRARYIKLGVTQKDVQQLLEEPRTCAYFDACLKGLQSASGPACAKLLLNAAAKRANEAGVALHDIGATAEQFAGLVQLRESGVVGAQSVDALLAALCAGDESAEAAAKRLGLIQIRDDTQLDAWIDAAIAANAQAAADVRAGKTAAMGRIVGAVMKASGGTADAAAARERVLSKLGGAS